MALVKGTITINSAGVATGTGMALRIYNGVMSALDADALAAVGSSMKQFCEGLAGAIVDEITENAEVTVTVQTTDSGLQRMSDPVLADADTQGPSNDVELFGTIA